MAEIADLAPPETAPAENPYLKIKAQSAYEADPENPYARIKAAEAKGVELDTEAPVGQPGFLGGVADIGRGLAKGVISTLPQQIGQAAQFFGAPETGKYLQDFAEQQAQAHPELKQSQVGQIANAEDLSLRGGAYSGGENLPLSSGPALAGAALGGTIGAVGGPAGAVAGAGVGYVVGSLAALPAFYGSQAQQSKEAIEKGLREKGVPEEEVQRQSNLGGHLSGAVEAGGELLADVIPFHALFNPLAKAVKGELVKSALGGVLKKTAATIAGTEVAEISTETAQQALEDQIEKEYGSGGPGATWKSTLSVVVPTALMTIIPGGFAAAHNFKTNLQVRGALAHGDADPEQRAAAAALVFHSIKGEDPVAAHAFDLYAANKIADQEPIELKDDAGYKQDWLNWLQHPDESTVPPQIELRPPTLQGLAANTLGEAAAQAAPTESQRMGIDPNAGPVSAAAATAVDSGATPVVQAQREDQAQAEGADEAAKQAEQQAKEAEQQRSDAWADLDRRLGTFRDEAKALETKAKASAGEGEPELPAVFKPLVIASSAHWDPTAATRAIKTALDEKRQDIVLAIVERAHRVATEAAEAKTALPPDSPLYAGAIKALQRKADAAQTTYEKLAQLSQLGGQNVVQVPGTSGVLPHPPGGAGETGGERVGVGQGEQGPPPTETGGGESGRGTGSGGEPAGPGTVTGPSTAAPLGQGENKQGNPPNGEGQKETPEAPPPVTPEPPAEPEKRETAGGTATPGQIEAGNAPLEHITAAGLPIALENKEGQTRKSLPGVEPPWESVIQKADYGYIKKTEGADGEKVDAFVKPGTPPDHAGPVFVIDQAKKDGGFDEHKVMLGYANQLEAVAAYKANYPAGWKVGPVTETTNEQLKDWLKNGNTKKPFAERESEPLDQFVAYDKLEETDEKGEPTGRYATGRVPARAALDDIDKRLEFAKAMRECLGV